MRNSQAARDEQAYQAVLAELRRDPRVPHRHVGVIVREGVVTLLGLVSSQAERAAAVEAAHRAAGARDVANEIRVAPSARMEDVDAQIARDIRRVLDANALMAHQPILCAVEQGWVTLAGEVDSLAGREAADEAVRSVGGVCGITNLIATGPGHQQPVQARRSHWGWC